MTNIIQTDKFSVNLLSNNNSKKVILYIYNSSFGDNAVNVYNQLCQQMIGIQDSFSFCVLDVKDWDKYLTPWEANGIMKNRCFDGCGRELLDDIETIVVSNLKKLLGDDLEIFIAGYSLAGLFALWSVYESDIWAGAVSCSGSLWYPDWIDFAKKNYVKDSCKIYLSLGNVEEKTKHPLMQKVGENTRKQYEYLQKDENITNTILEWNEGGHFTNVDERIVKGMQWVLK